MQYRTYAYKSLDAPWTYDRVLPGGTTRTLYIYDTLVYASGGAVVSYTIDNDYMLNNNSTIKIAKTTKAVPGQIITLIDDMGSYDMGVVSSVDNEKLEIQYKNMMSLFDRDDVNPGRKNPSSGQPLGDGTSAGYRYYALSDTAHILESYYCAYGLDSRVRLPIYVQLGSSEDEIAIWPYTDISFNVKDWLITLFDTHNVTLSFRLVFETSNRAYINVYVSANGQAHRLIKNNVSDMEIEQESKATNKPNIAKLVNDDTGSIAATYYLTTTGNVTTDKTNPNLVPGYRVTVVEVNSYEYKMDPDLTYTEIAKNALVDSTMANHYIRLSYDKNSAMLPKNLAIGERVRIVPRIYDMDIRSTIPTDFTDDVIDSVYSGRKETSTSNRITLIFGKIRVNYTDLIQMQEIKRVRR